MLNSNTIYLTHHILDVRSMVKKLYYLKTKDKGNKISNVGGWQNSEELINFKEFLPLSNMLNSLIESSIDLKGYGMWGNISSTSHYNKIHNHGAVKNLWSGVYYLQTPLDSGNIVFYNAKGLIWKEYSPNVYDLLLFHSSTPHSVKVNNSKEDRISIAFNFYILD